jgi:hypothetical protein
MDCIEEEIMGKGLGIAALVIAIISIFIPIVGVFTGWLALILAAVGALAGDVVFTVAVVAISAVSYIFLSPTMWLATAGANANPGPGSPSALLIVTFILLAAPIAALILRATGRVVLGSSRT